ncbi:uncharacterized protein BP01DRAFT_410331 [Aspergillus saccharolyticus JOP 1030-1]|uniref:CHAT domain-containing protein n=1 Tax=Aspergillus saccharolyticus JOP 1030-1 TaxID=1450539 RepID=A0A318ZT09_9EURO|nr:hypothetical protein BP01DRAFT_410331 [Aspergillus saccharolyticus JOP 1030-1]PYH47503.1 hypothetical protein BP01DRAFT_410331 [Aspergillus saccharolyticus JOP 1030-1]
MFNRTGDLEVLNNAIELQEQATQITQDEDVPILHMLEFLGAMFASRFQRTGSIGDLNRAIELTRLKVDSDLGSSTTLLGNFGAMLGERFSRTGSADDLGSALTYLTEASKKEFQIGQIDISTLINLGMNLGRRFEQTGSREDLDRAIGAFSSAVDLFPEDRSERPLAQASLGTWLCTRYESTGSMEDLNRSIELLSSAVDAGPQASYQVDVGGRAHLGNALGRRFERTGSLSDLDRAIEVFQQALDYLPLEDPSRRAACLGDLATWLGRRTGSIDDLNLAIEKLTLAVKTITPGDPDENANYANLGTWLTKRFQVVGSIDDLNRAIDYFGLAVQKIPRQHLHYCQLSFEFGRALLLRYRVTESAVDHDRALNSFQNGWMCRNASPYNRLLSAHCARQILTASEKWQEASELMQGAMELLPNISPRTLQHSDKQYRLAEFSGSASTAAAICLHAGKEPYHALKLLDLGRDIIAGLLMEMRGDISDLEQQHPTLARDFLSLRDILDSPRGRIGDFPSVRGVQNLESEARHLREADERMKTLIETIRAQPQFHNFLLPPTAGEMIAAADPDPMVVINVSGRCDAFLIDRNQIRVLNLPLLRQGEVSEWVVRLRSSPSSIAPLLEWLWDTIAHPVLEALGFTDPVSDGHWPRVWWIPTGLLGSLPLHAAGYHQKRSGETVLDRVMSSYASSVKALIYSRQRHRSLPSGHLSDHAVLAAMRQTPGLPVNGVLPFAAHEVEMLENLCPSLHLAPVRPTLRKADVLASLKQCKLFHFAGHGHSDPVDPSRSHLLLTDWDTDPLTVGDLRDSKLQENPPFLAYLSACSTGMNRVNQLTDEGIHLISAFQLAGFRHVVGTLWEVSDQHCVSVAKVLYETLRDEGMTDIAVVRGLHNAVKALRDADLGPVRDSRDAEPLDEDGGPKQENNFATYYWVPYIHFGI